MIKTRTQEQTKTTGMHALTKVLGPVDTVGFIRQFKSGADDYTKERHELFKNETIENITARIKERRKRKR